MVGVGEGVGGHLSQALVVLTTTPHPENILPWIVPSTAVGTHGMKFVWKKCSHRWCW